MNEGPFCDGRARDVMRNKEELVVASQKAGNERTNKRYGGIPRRSKPRRMGWMIRDKGVDPNLSAKAAVSED